ncbi:hypothetical protein I4F81_010697 [Pyropia yezoensis]|uniref:Uncharacterized protein n=1 Tax=Pyropia yezoensis TaxID=2788 RepID=A0ACC3CEF7_PYRYE|nr:hypothetical protein I4F81_010697 [Neopyropia yezoensis]
MCTTECVCIFYALSSTGYANRLTLHPASKQQDMTAQPPCLSPSPTLLTHSNAAAELPGEGVDTPHRDSLILPRRGRLKRRVPRVIVALLVRIGRAVGVIDGGGGRGGRGGGRRGGRRGWGGCLRRTACPRTRRTASGGGGGSSSSSGGGGGGGGDGGAAPLARPLGPPLPHGTPRRGGQCHRRDSRRRHSAGVRTPLLGRCVPAPHHPGTLDPRPRPPPLALPLFPRRAALALKERDAQAEGVPPPPAADDAHPRPRGQVEDLPPADGPHVVCRHVRAVGGHDADVHVHRRAGGAQARRQARRAHRDDRQRQRVEARRWCRKGAIHKAGVGGRAGRGGGGGSGGNRGRGRGWGGGRGRGGAPFSALGGGRGSARLHRPTGNGAAVRGEGGTDAGGAAPVECPQGRWPFGRTRRHGHGQGEREGRRMGRW